MGGTIGKMLTHPLDPLAQVGGSVQKYLDPFSGIPQYLNPITGGPKLTSDIGKHYFGDQGRLAGDPLGLVSHADPSQVDYTNPGVPRFGSGNIPRYTPLNGQPTPAPAPAPQPGGIATAPGVAQAPPVAGTPPQLPFQPPPPKQVGQIDPQLLAKILSRMDSGFGGGH